MFTIKVGDLFASDADAYAHGVNARGIMGAGIAVAFRLMDPEMYEAYRAHCDRFGDALAGLIFPWYSLGSDKIIYNCFTQKVPGRGEARYGLVERSAIAMLFDAEDRGLDTVGLPAIGCGIGGLEAHNVQDLYARILGPSSVDFTMYIREEDKDMFFPEIGTGTKIEAGGGQL